MDNRFAADPDTTTPADPARGNDYKDLGALADDDSDAKPMREDKKLKKM